MAALPKEIQYNKPMASLPMDTQMNNTIVHPSNGANFKANGNVITFDLPTHSMLVPSSLCLNGIIKITPSPETQTLIAGQPAASWIQRVETLVGGTQIDSITDYGRLYNMIAQTKIDYATKAGLMTELAVNCDGLDAAAPAEADGNLNQNLDGNAMGDPTFVNLNGRRAPSFRPANDAPAVTKADAVEGEFAFSLPLGCLLSSCSELIPLSMMGGVRIRITTAQLSSYVRTVKAVYTDDDISSFTETGATAPVFDFSELELNFDLVDFGEGFDGVVKSMADPNGDLVIRSEGWNTMNVPIDANASTANNTYLYNLRLSSIKSLVLQGTGEARQAAIIPAYQAVQVAGSTGSTQFFVANRPFPPSPLDESNVAAVMSSLRQCFGEAHDVYSTRIAIPDKQYTTLATVGTQTLADDTSPVSDNQMSVSVFEPAAHFVGVNTEKLSTNAVMMSGESSQLSPIEVLLNQSDATTAAGTLTLYTCYDALLAINTRSRGINVRV
jgi:hypothetical protein